MPYQLTRREVIARITMRALLDNVPGMTQRRLAGLFHASTRTVNDAAKRSVSDWFVVLEAAKDTVTPASVVRPKPFPRKKPYLADPPMPVVRSFGKGTRKDLVPVKDDDGGDGFDPDLSNDQWQDPDDSGLDEEQERQAEKAAREW
jgi:hypothetical protein